MHLFYGLGRGFLAIDSGGSQRRSDYVRVTTGSDPEAAGVNSTIAIGGAGGGEVLATHRAGSARRHAGIPHESGVRDGNYAEASDWDRRVV
jgi:hypothetical protein